MTAAFLASGHKVAGITRKLGDAERPTEQFLPLLGDLSRQGGMDEAIRQTLSHWGRIDGLVHLVGGFAGGQTVAETDDATFDKMIDMNLRAAFTAIRAVLPVLRAQGSGAIVAIGSKAAVEASPMAGVYAASKAALVSLLQTVARENRDRNITANAILPGTMDTPANRAFDPDGDHSAWTDPRQVASLALYLVSDAASQVSGTAIRVDRGA